MLNFNKNFCNGVSIYYIKKRMNISNYVTYATGLNVFNELIIYKGITT